MIMGYLLLSDYHRFVVFGWNVIWELYCQKDGSALSRAKIAERRVVVVDRVCVFEEWVVAFGRVFNKCVIFGFLVFEIDVCCLISKMLSYGQTEW